MTDEPLTVLCRYQYDPTDRLASCAPMSQQSIQRFYRNDRLATEIQGGTQHSFFEHGTQVLAQQKREAGKVDCALLATDLQGSVLHTVAAGQHQQIAYSAFGHRSPESGLISLLGFTGERRDGMTGHYLLGKGYRAFNSVLNRFNSPDDLSPFEMGGINAYAYCGGDPVNFVDPSGHSLVLASFFRFRALTAGNAASDLVSKGVNKLSSSAKKLENLGTQNSARSISNFEHLHTSRIEALDLALPQSSDLGKLKHALAERMQAQEVLDSANEQYSVLERFVASPPRRKDGTIEVENFNPSDIVNQRDYKRLVFAQRRVDSSQAALDHVKNQYFARYPRDLQEHIAKIRSVGRRRSF
ncbi:hypothetical protein PS918_04787 [Pseudomonas fluorescens]|uniref:RHS repeat-associated core domain-containing protein n=1 Tax=Pseudomonas fluorescens TaxID=294 RepID=A0A5E7U6F3_PSEFL|nr:RHS repeat-associated core domain-containing protein [Pseudomonas fluorescens]VVQ06942.1 hypothetical protein PS918_04787 [Pseudomonas fluorescens]